MEGPNEKPEGSQVASVPNIHDPFSLAERFQQLAEIDQDIVRLLSLTKDAILPLCSPVAASGSDAAAVPQDFSNAAAIDTDAQVQAFKEAVDGFLATLHSVDVRLKRQIWGLEEAGIISLKERRSGGVSLEPNGVGDVGDLDVGWLNSRSSKVERDMEAELWTKMRTALECLGQGQGQIEDGPKGMSADMPLDEP